MQREINRVRHYRESLHTRRPLQCKELVRKARHEQQEKDSAVGGFKAAVQPRRDKNQRGSNDIQGIHVPLKHQSECVPGQIERHITYCEAEHLPVVLGHPHPPRVREHKQ